MTTLTVAFTYQNVMSTPTGITYGFDNGDPVRDASVTIVDTSVKTPAFPNGTPFAGTFATNAAGFVTTTGAGGSAPPEIPAWVGARDSLTITASTTAAAPLRGFTVANAGGAAYTASQATGALNALPTSFGGIDVPTKNITYPTAGTAFGTAQATDGAFAIFDDLVTSAVYATTIIGSSPLSKTLTAPLAVTYPTPTTPATAQQINSSASYGSGSITIGQSLPFSFDTVAHEVGHYLADLLAFNNNTTILPNGGTVPINTLVHNGTENFRYVSQPNSTTPPSKQVGLQQAFNEGWADYFAVDAARANPNAPGVIKTLPAGAATTPATSEVQIKLSSNVPTFQFSMSMVPTGSANGTATYQTDSVGAGTGTVVQNAVSKRSGQPLFGFNSVGEDNELSVARTLFQLQQKYTDADGDSVQFSQAQIIQAAVNARTTGPAGSTPGLLTPPAGVTLNGVINNLMAAASANLGVAANVQAMVAMGSLLQAQNVSAVPQALPNASYPQVTATQDPAGQVIGQTPPTFTWMIPQAGTTPGGQASALLNAFTLQFFTSDLTPITVPGLNSNTPLAPGLGFGGDNNPNGVNSFVVASSITSNAAQWTPTPAQWAAIAATPGPVYWVVIGRDYAANFPKGATPPANFVDTGNYWSGSSRFIIAPVQGQQSPGSKGPGFGSQGSTGTGMGYNMSVSVSVPGIIYSPIIFGNEPFDVTVAKMAGHFSPGTSGNATVISNSNGSGPINVTVREPYWVGVGAFARPAGYVTKTIEVTPGNSLLIARLTAAGDVETQLLPNSGNASAPIAQPAAANQAGALNSLGIAPNGIGFDSASGVAVQNMLIQALNSGTSTTELATIATTVDDDGTTSAGPTVQFAGFAGTMVNASGQATPYGFSVYSLPIANDPLISLTGFNGVPIGSQGAGSGSGGGSVGSGGSGGGSGGGVGSFGSIGTANGALSSWLFGGPGSSAWQIYGPGSASWQYGSAGWAAGSGSAGGGSAGGGSWTTSPGLTNAFGSVGTWLFGATGWTNGSLAMAAIA